jgi:predicted O-methyltransferase YrrM
MKFHHAAKYLEYLVFSRRSGGHGIHSPFVFDLVSTLFRNKTAADVVCNIEIIRKSLLKDRRNIVVNDMGSGREKRKTPIRKVSEIARNSAIPERYGRLLSNLAGRFGNGTILELGTSLGISTMYMASASSSASVYTIDACRECSGIAAENFSSTGLSNIRQINGSFDDVLPSLLSAGLNPGFVFIDGDHRKKAVTENFSLLAESSGSAAVIAIDDIHDSREMTEAWDEIRHHAKVTATIDIFRMGIVFFREGITRNHYIIRY